MKNLISIILCALPLAAAAQTNVKQAFDNLITFQKAEVIETHNLEKDPATGTKVSQLDTYTFTLGKKNAQLVKTVEAAFLKDSEQAYSYTTGQTSKDNKKGVTLAVGDGNGTGVDIGQKNGQKYVYACFLAPEDSTGTHRYAYALEWLDTGNGDFITGRLVVTYATTQTYRQSKQKEVRLIGSGGSILSNIQIGNNGRITIGNEASWFETFTTYTTAMTTADMNTRRSLAAKIYSHTKNAKDVDDRDKKTAIRLLNTMLKDKMRYDDQYIQDLLSAAIANLQ